MFIHLLADVQSKKIGTDTSIWQFTVILPNAIIGDNCNINAHCFIENDVNIGNNVTIKCGVYIWDGVTIEDYAFIGPSVTFINDKFPRSKIYPKELIGVYIEQGASIGANATIFGGIRIGKYAMIGAGSIVNKNIPAYSIWIGNPAQPVGYVCECGHTLNKSLICMSCDTKYSIVADEITKL